MDDGDYRKFTLSVKMVVDCCARAFSVLTAWMLLPLHRRFIGCDLDLECVALRILQLALILARQVLNEDADTTGEEDV